MDSFVSALDEEDRAVYDKVVECISVGFHADRPEEHVPMATAFCDAFKVWIKLSKRIQKSSD